MKVFFSRTIVPILLVLLFAAPGISAYFLFHHPEWLSAAKTNRGELLGPPIQLKALTYPETKWRLLLWYPTTCHDACQRQLEKLAKIRLALGRRLFNTDAWLLLGADAEPLSTPLQLTLEDYDMHFYKLTANDADDAARLPANPTLYIVNPTGYMVLAYSVEANPDDMHHDLKHLLKMKE